MSPRRITALLSIFGIPLLLASAARAQEVATTAPLSDSSSTAASADRVDRLEREVEELRAAVRALQQQLQQQPHEQQPAAATAVDGVELSRRIDLLAQEIETLKLGESAAAPEATASTATGSGPAPQGFGPAASKVYRSTNGVSIGGYGEMLYQNFARRDQSGSVAVNSSDEVDLLRGVFYLGYKLDDRFLFNSEIEFEHSGSADTHQEGEAGLEFAYVDYLARPGFGARAGLVLLPTGFLNELHEPPIYLGARRNDVESVILPTTWRAPGFGLFGGGAAWSWRTYLVNGLDASKFTPDEGVAPSTEALAAKAKARDFAWVGRLDYTGTPGLLVGASAYRGDSGQGMLDADGRRIGARTTIVEGHAEWRWRGLRLRGLAARGTIDDTRRLDEALGLAGAAAIGSEQRGAYVEAGYDLFALWPHGPQSLTPFARVESLDTQHEVAPGFARDPLNDRRILTLGLQYKPIDPLVVKADWQRIRNQARTGVDQLNVALGYLF